MDFLLLVLTVLGRELDSKGHNPMYVPSALSAEERGMTVQELG